MSREWKLAALTAAWVARKLARKEFRMVEMLGNLAGEPGRLLI